MSAYTERSMIGKRANEPTYSRNDAENVRLVRYPKEVTVFGNISRVYVEGQDNQERIIFERDQLPPPQERHGQKAKNYVIIPVKDDRSEIQFVKTPIYKLRRHPKSKKVGDTEFCKLNPFGGETTEAKLPKWSAKRTEMDQWNEFVVPDSETGTSFRFCQTESVEDYAPVVREREHQQKSGVKYSSEDERTTEEQHDPPPKKKQKHNQDSERGHSRFLQYLITLKGRTRKEKKQ